MMCRTAGYKTAQINVTQGKRKLENSFRIVCESRRVNVDVSEAAANADNGRLLLLAL